MFPARIDYQIEGYGPVFNSVDHSEAQSQVALIKAEKLDIATTL